MEFGIKWELLEKKMKLKKLIKETAVGFYNGDENLFSVFIRRARRTIIWWSSVLRSYM